MTLVKWNPNAIFPTFTNLVNDLFNDTDITRMMGNDLATTTPAVNIKENKDAFVVEVAVPGMKKENFHINIENDVLTISAEVKTEEEKKEEKFTRKEFSYSAFKRAFTLPKTVEAEKIAANYKEGILHITIPKREEAKAKLARTIEIK